MNDKGLADRVVALGVGHIFDDWYIPPRGDEYDDRGDPDDFIDDWRVAGALMEKVIEWGGFNYVGSCTTDTFQATAFRGYGHQKKTNHGVNESLCRAIIEACVEALDE